MAHPLTRRDLLRQASLSAGLAALGGVWPGVAAAEPRSPNEKLNIACIGCGGKGEEDIANVSGENIVALCDVDEARAAGTFKKFPNVPKYQDFRKMLERKDIDAVTVTTPDHIHASAALLAMSQGRHVYVQKPLTHTVSEARQMLETARKHRVVTQMGNQGHSFAGNIRAVELIQAGAIGPVTEVHVITDRPKGWWPQGLDRPTDTPPVPATLAWDLWLGPAPERPYNPAYLPFVWRGWWDFGTGALGDMACHLMDVPFWSLGLKYPTAVEAKSAPVKPESPPVWSVITYDFPQRGDQPPVRLIWYDGGQRPSAEALEGRELAPDFNGSILVGSKGKMLLEHGKDPVLLPESRFAGFTGPPETLPRPESHYKQWIEACKGRGTTGSSFEYAAPMTETILLGNVALRTGKRIEYDPRHLRARGVPEAEQYIEAHYRTGW